MRVLKEISIACMVMIFITNFAWQAFCQSNIAGKNIPSNIPAEIREATKKLGSPDPNERAKAAYTLGNMGEAAAIAVPFLEKIMDDNREVEFEVFYTDTKGEFVHEIRLGWVGAEAMEALGRIGKPGLPILINALTKENLDRSIIARELGRIADTRAIEPLITALKDPKTEDAFARVEIINSLRKFKDERIIVALIEALKDKYSEVREKAAETLGQLKDIRAVEPLIESLKDEDFNVRSYVAWALAEIKDPRAIEPLINTLINEDDYDKTIIAKQLKKITGQDFGSDAGKWQQWWQMNKGSFKYDDN